MTASLPKTAFKLAASKFASKCAAIGLVLAVVAVAYAALVAPLQQWLAATADQIATERALAIRLSDAAAAVRSRQVGPSAAGASVGDPADIHRRLLIDGDSDTVVAARAQAHLRAIVDGAGPSAIRLLSARSNGIRTLAPRASSDPAPRPQGALRAASVELQLVAKWEHIPALLAALRAAEPVVMTETVQIVGSTRRSAEPEATGAADVYDIRLELQTFAAGRPNALNAPDAAGMMRPAAEPKEAGVEPLPRR
jgi:hypothetical protein